MKDEKKRREQELPDQLTGAILDFIRTKFYGGNTVQFSKERKDLLRWVVWKLAWYLNSKGVTLPIERYREIVLDSILMDAVRFGNTTKVKYVPAFLKVVMDRHLAMHGEEYYEEGKRLRSRVDFLVSKAQIAIGKQPDPVEEMATAYRLLGARKRPVKAPAKEQLTLL